MRRHLLPIIIILLYLATRLFGMVMYEPHTDEVIYTQFAQKIAEDWPANKYISIDGSMYQDYKEPLQYWLTATTVNIFDNPLMGTRIWSVLMGLMGLIFTYLFTKKLFDRNAAILTSLFIITASYFSYFDSIAIAEVYVYACGMAALFFLLKTIERWQISSFLLAILFLTLASLSKMSSTLWMLLALSLPLTLYTQRTQYTLNTLKIIAAIFATSILHKLLLPDIYDSIAAASHARRVLTMNELLSFPVSTWISHGLRAAGEVFWSEWSVAAPLVLLIPFFGIWKLKSDHLKCKRLTIVFVWFMLMFTIPVIFLRFPYVRFTGASLIFFFMALSVTLVTFKTKRIVISILIVFFTFKLLTQTLTLSQYHFTDTALAEAQGGWPVGIGMTEMIKKLSTLPQGVLIYDPQWGHPGTTIQVFSAYYPQLELAPGLAPVVEKLPEIKAEAERQDKNLYLIFDARGKGERALVDQLLDDPTYCNTKEIIEKRYKGIKLEGTEIDICRTK